MAGIRIKLPLKFTNTALPILQPDPVLAAGSLVLIEPADVPTVPVAGGLVTYPNLAAAKALPLLAAGAVQGDTNPILGVSSTLDAAVGKFEKTARGGLHYVNTQTNGVAGQGAQLRLPVKIRDYIAANPTHKFGLWAWTKITRASIDNASGGQHQQITFARAQTDGQASTVGAKAHQNTTLMLTYGANWAWFAPDPTHVANLALYYDLRMGNSAAGSTGRQAAAVLGGWSRASSGAPAVPTAGADLVASLNFGAFGGQGNEATALLNKAPSFVLYRLYFEDLTVSGRSAATVDALDLAAFNSAFGVGGRYNGDTHTAPASLVA